MSLHLIDLIKGQLGPALVSQAATQLGESESGISKAINGLLPAVVGGLANNSDNPTVINAVTDANSTGILSNLEGTPKNAIVTSTLPILFGDKTSDLVNSVSNFAGISDSSTNSLLDVVTGATLGTVGKYAADNHLDASGISSLLSDQKNILTTILPAGLSLGSLGLGLENIFGGAVDAVKDAGAAAGAAVNNVKDKITGVLNSDDDNNGGGGSFWKWLLPLLLLLLAGWFLWKQCNNKNDMATVATGTGVDSTAMDSTAAGAKDSTAIDSTAAGANAGANGAAGADGAKTEESFDLNGTTIKGYKGGMEDKMISFLKSGGYDKAADDAALKDTWYNFDHVNFKMGSSNQLEEGSQGQLDNLVAILKAYPKSKIKIGAYTDKTGSEAGNLKLSKQRAEDIKARLTKAGVGGQILAADGYGSQFAKVPATASDAERASDRKIAVRFAK